MVIVTLLIYPADYALIMGLLTWYEVGDIYGTSLFTAVAWGPEMVPTVWVTQLTQPR